MSWWMAHLVVVHHHHDPVFSSELIVFSIWDSGSDPEPLYLSAQQWSYWRLMACCLHDSHLWSNFLLIWDRSKLQTNVCCVHKHDKVWNQMFEEMHLPSSLRCRTHRSQAKENVWLWILIILPSPTCTTDHLRLITLTVSVTDCAEYKL